jgi:hypothetical protein
VQAGVVQSSGEPPRYRYHPRDVTLAATIDSLAALYASTMVEVMHLIHDQAGRSAQRFANAFKLRKDR